MALKKIEPINQTYQGILYDFSSDEANSDPIRTARLMDAVSKGDKEAIKQFNKLQNTPMYREEE